MERRKIQRVSTRSSALQDPTGDDYLECIKGAKIMALSKRSKCDQAYWLNCLGVEA